MYGCERLPDGGVSGSSDDSDMDVQENNTLQEAKENTTKKQKPAKEKSKSKNVTYFELSFHFTSLNNQQLMVQFRLDL